MKIRRSLSLVVVSLLGGSLMLAPLTYAADTAGAASSTESQPVKMVRKAKATKHERKHHRGTHKHRRHMKTTALSGQQQAS